ncbi:MAG: choice-of-anchor R domain-containing protein [Verrucomicrobiota bacterium]
MMFKSTFLPVLTVVFILSAVTSRAAVIFDSLGPVIQDVCAQVMADAYYADSFVVGPQNYQLTTVVLNMRSTSHNDGNFFVQLWDATGAGNRPGNLLQTLSGADHPAADSDYTYNGSASLSANTAYFVVMGVSSGPAQYFWNATHALNSQSIGYSVSTNGAASWAPLASDGTGYMQINGNLSPVPEPSTWAIASGAMLGLLWVIKRR